MRSIARFEQEDQARSFSDCLLARGIENEVDEGADSTWTVWVHSEDSVDRARDLLEAYLRDPKDPRFSDSGAVARRIRQEAKKRPKDSRVRHVDMRTQLARPQTPRLGRLTMALIGISVAVSILSRLGEDQGIISHLSITVYELTGTLIRWIPGFPEIMDGQIWRLFTPMFIHYGIIHLVFNMLWLKDLGSMIEARQGFLYLAALVLVISALSNLGQYLAAGPGFGGMSGVVYGLLGYAWIRGRLDPGMGYHVNRYIILMMTVWFLLGFTGLIGHIANAAHGVGFGLGIAWGAISARLFRGRRR
jgi:GlpG protein